MAAPAAIANAGETQRTERTERTEAELNAIADAAEDAARQAEEEASVKAAEKAAAIAAGTDGSGTGSPAAKSAAEKAREGYEARKSKERIQLDELTAELAGYKRRDEEARKAELTKEALLQEERDRAVEESTRLKRQITQAQIGAELKLPRTLWDRITGSDDAAMRADAEELAKIVARPRAGSVTDPGKETSGGSVTFKRSQIADRAFYLANEKAIQEAYRDGRITEG